MAYNWQQPDWPHFTYSIASIEDDLYSFAREIGQISGLLKALPEQTETEAVIDIMVSEAIKTSEIEGEHLNRADVVSSIKNNLGMNVSPEKVKDKMADGIGELMVDVHRTFREPLTFARLFAWHKMILKPDRQIKVGVWRTHIEPMQVISGAIGKEKVHFEAPPSSAVTAEMKAFVKWFNDTAPGGKQPIKYAPVRAAIAHLYFETIHPFEDGNGRVGRALAEKALAQTVGHTILISLSRTIEADKKMYYASLESAQKQNEISDWLNYFVKVCLQAQRQARELVEFILKKSRFYDQYKNTLNERQLKVISRVFEEGPEGFKGGINVRKYIAITKTSKATATRDLQELAKLNVFVTVGSARSTSYLINM